MRLAVEDYLQLSRGKYGYCALITCDVERFQRFVDECRAARRRPPSLLVYIARCLGKVLESKLEILAARLDKNTVVTPTQIDVMIVVERTAHDGTSFPDTVVLENAGARTLNDMAAELTPQLRAAKREVLPPPPASRLFVPAWSPRPWREFARWVRAHRPGARKFSVPRATCVHLSSTSQWLGGRTGWGVSLYTINSLNVTLGGLSKRAVVVDEQIVAHWCVDITLTFDHVLVDGAPATRFVAELFDEIESGRALSEF